MRCQSCSNDIDVSGVFPGARISCMRCGVVNEVTATTGASAYRTPGRVVEAPLAPLVRRTDAASLQACPRCGGHLDDGDVQPCPACGGAFVSHAALDGVLAERRAERTTLEALSQGPTLEAEVRYLRCPCCGEVMNRALFGRRSGVVVDVCRAHGTWFDPTELDRAAAFVAKNPGAVTKPPPPPPDAEAIRRRAELEAAMARESATETRAIGRRTGHAASLLDLVAMLFDDE